MSQTDEFKCDLQIISRQFLAMYPLNKMQITNDLASCNVEWQNDLINCTVRNPIGVLYPPSSQYMKTFLKHVILKLEQAGVEIIDELYELFANLLHNPQHDDDLCFKTYFFDNDKYVVLKESTNIVSRGTTGLCLWQASQHLAEMFLENREIISNKTVLELGSGLGFLGLVICKSCQPLKVLFSDCHSDVIDLMVSNIERNLMVGNRVDSTEKSSSTAGDGKLVDVLWNGKSNSQGRVSVSVIKLDWQHVTQDELQNLSSSVDIIIAADVVYDETIIPYLVRVLTCLLNRPNDKVSSSRSRPTAIISSTVRNTETRDRFLEALVSAGLVYRCLPNPSKRTFFYDRSVLIQTIEISFQSVSNASR